MSYILLYIFYIISYRHILQNNEPIIDVSAKKRYTTKNTYYIWRRYGETIKNNQSKNTSLAKTIADQINDYIQKQELKPGDRIETELEMAKKLNVSRGTIREAVKILVSRNVLEVHKGSGTYISKKKGITEDPLGLSFTY